MGFATNQTLHSASISPALISFLHDCGIYTVGALMQTDAYKAMSSGRYDLELIREVNGLPIDALRKLVDEALACQLHDCSGIAI